MLFHEPSAEQTLLALYLTFFVKATENTHVHLYTILLHGLPMLVAKTNFGLVLYNHANFYWFEETSSYWSVKQISVFLGFALVNQRHTSGITVYNHTVTNQRHCAGRAQLQ